MPSPAGGAHAWPLIGRDEELEFLRVARGRKPPASVVVSGLPGVGKSRLVSEALEAARVEGWGVLRVCASAGLSSVAFGPFRTAVALPQTKDLGELVAALDDALSRLRGGRGLMLLVDDGHDLDEASAGYVHQLAMVGSAVAMVTLRSGAERPSALTALWKDGRAERVELEGLSRGETVELVTAALETAVDDATIERIWQLTDGNPLYVREVLLSTRETGALRLSDGVWRWQDPFTTGVRLREIVAERLGRLDPDELTAVELLSVARSLSFDLLVSLCGVATLERLESRALVAVERSGRRVEVSLAHPLYGEVLRAGMPALRAQSARRLLTNSLQRTGALRSGDRVNLALWALEGDIEVDPVTLTQVADVVLWHPGQEISDRLEEILAGTIARSRPKERSIAQGDARLAVRLARAGYSSSGTIAAGAVLATTLCWAGALGEAAEVLTELGAVAPTGDDQTRLAVALAEVTFWGEHRHEDAMAILSDAASKLDPGSGAALLAELNEKLAGYELNTTRPAAALSHAEQAAALIGEELAVSFAAPAAAASLAHLGRCAAALELIERALPAASERGRHSMEVPQLLFARTGALSRAGRLEEACELAETCRQVALSIDSRDGTALFGVSLAETMLRQGRPRSAARIFLDSVGLFEERDVFGYLPWALAGLSRARALLGDGQGAALALAEAERAATGTRYFDLWLYDARSAINRLAGGEGEALDSARRGADWARRAEMPVEEAFLVHAEVRIAPARGAVERLEELADLTDSNLVALLARHADGLRRSDPEALLATSEGLAGCSARFAAAEAAAAAAEIYERRHLARPARAAAWAALDHLERCEGARSPLLDRLVAPEGLTRREYEVATLAGEGHSSKEIGARMHLSTRTVDSHLYRAYSKLGVSGRQQLTAALRDRSDPATGPTAAIAAREHLSRDY
jgi:DNA-binding CsgD family transcriptional regulator